MDEIRQTFGPELCAALVAAQAELQNPDKNRKVDSVSKAGHRLKYGFADLPAVIDAVRLVFAKNGLAITHLKNASGLVARLVHASGQFMDSTYDVPDGMSAQEFGSWLTYMRRYSTCNIAFVAGDEDEDGQLAEAAMDSQKEAQKEAAKAALKQAAKEKRLTPVTPADPEPEPQGRKVNERIQTAMELSGVTKAQLDAYYAARRVKHLGNDAPERIEDVPLTYVETMLENWEQVASAIKKGTK